MNLEIQQEKIRERAYTFFLERGQQAGSALEDWTRAEREVAEETANVSGVKDGANEMLTSNEVAARLRGSTTKHQSGFPEIHKRPSESRQANSIVRRKY